MPAPGNTDWLYRALEDAGIKPGELGFTSELARRAELSRQTVTKVLNGEILRPSVDVCRALAGVIGWSTVQVMEAFQVLKEGDRKVIGNGPPLWKPTQGRDRHYADATALVATVEHRLGQIHPDEWGPEHLTLMLRAAQVRATLACANTREIAMEADR